VGLAIADHAVVADAARTDETQVHVVGVTRRDIEREALPSWLSLPERIDIALPEGVKIDAIESTVVSHEMPRAAALVGVLRNAGRPLRGARYRLDLVAADGATLARIHSDTTPGHAETGARLPFRFALAAAEGRAPVALRLDIEEDDSSTRRTRAAAVDPGFRVRAAGAHGVTITGTLAPIDGHARLTLALRDRNGRLIDLLAGPVTGEGEARPRFTLEGEFPIARRVKTLEAWLETPD
jgi:hypothetical protein